jgi:hypothetical protein
VRETNPIAIYLAGPIDDIGQNESRGWRERIAEILPTSVVCFSPAHAFIGTNKENFRAVDFINRHAIKCCCTGVLANLAGPGQGFGTIREIEFAVMTNTPVAVAGQIESWMSHDIMVGENLGEALNLLLQEIANIRNVPPMIMTIDPREFFGASDDDDA